MCAYDWCDIYAKINLNKENKEKEKIISIGPSFAIQLWNKPSTLKHFILNYISSRKDSYITFKMMFKDYVYTIYRRKPYSKYLGGKSSSDYIFTLSTLWYDELTYKTTNKLRGIFVRLCQNLFKNFEGGDSIIYPIRLQSKNSTNIRNI